LKYDRKRLVGMIIMKLVKIDLAIRVIFPYQGIIPLGIIDRQLVEFTQKFNKYPLSDFEIIEKDDDEKKSDPLSGKRLLLVFNKVGDDSCVDDFYLSESIITQKLIMVVIKPDESFYEREFNEQIEILEKQEKHFNDYCVEIINAINEISPKIVLKEPKQLRNHYSLRGEIQLDEKANFSKIYNDDFVKILDSIAKKSNIIHKDLEENTHHPLFHTRILPKKFEEFDDDDDNKYEDLLLSINSFSFDFSDPKAFRDKKVTFRWNNPDISVFGQAMKDISKIIE